MPATPKEDSQVRSEARRVVIAGGGVAALEAMLALRDKAGDLVSTVVLAPDPHFRYRPLSVTEPFSLSTPHELRLEDLASELRADFICDSLGRVEPDRGAIFTGRGSELPYDSLLVTIGARSGVTIPGALAFWDSADRGAFAEALARLESGRTNHLCFAIPSGVGWPLGMYELALLTAHHLKRTRRDEVELTLVTPEASPMRVFGKRPSESARAMLDDAGISFLGAVSPQRFEGGELKLDGGPSIRCDEVVSMPVPEVPQIQGLPQDSRGFITVDRFGKVLGLEDVYAAGDVTTFPIKQGGLATQAADSAAAAIAEAAGADVEVEPFRPVLRGAMLTQWGPRFMRTERPGGFGTVATSALWWPPGKVAGRYITPFLTAQAGHGGRAVSHLTDLNPPPGEKPGEPSAAHGELVDHALDSAQMSAEHGQYEQALHWLEIAEDLEMYLPPEAEADRAAWRARADA